MKQGWQLKKLSEVCIVERGSSPRPIKEYFTTRADGVNWIKIGDTEEGGKYVYSTAQKITLEGAKQSRFVKEGDFILTNSMSFGRPYIMKTSGYIHDGWFVLRLKEFIDTDYFYHLLSSDVIQSQFRQLASGAIVQNISGDLVKMADLPIPPLSEQKHIVGILDEAFEGIATAKANAEKNLQNARALFESHLQSVFTQRGKGWEEKLLGSICEVKDGTHDSPKYVTEGIPFVTQKNIREEGLSFADTKFIKEQDHQDFYRRSNVARGDILISMIGANRGMACIVDDSRTFSIKNVGLVKPSKTLNQTFLLNFLKSPQAANYVRDGSKGGAQEFIGLTELRKFPIPIPPLSSQTFLAAQFQDLRNETESLASLYERKLAALDELKKSLLHQAFSGQLTIDNG